MNYNHIYWYSYCDCCKTDINVNYCINCNNYLNVHFCSYCFNSYDNINFINKECLERKLEIEYLEFDAYRIISKFVSKIMLKKRLIKYSNYILDTYFNPDSIFISNKFKHYNKKKSKKTKIHYINKNNKLIKFKLKRKC